MGCFSALLVVNCSSTQKTANFPHELLKSECLKHLQNRNPFLHLEHICDFFSSWTFCFTHCQSATQLKRRQVALDAECLHAGGLWSVIGTCTGFFIHFHFRTGCNSASLIVKVPLQSKDGKLLISLINYMLLNRNPFNTWKTFVTSFPLEHSTSLFVKVPFHWKDGKLL